MQAQEAIKNTAELIEEIDIGIKSLSEKTQKSYSTKFSARTFETALKRIAKSNVILSHQFRLNKLKSSLVTCGFSYNSYNSADSRRERVLIGTQLSLKRTSNLLPINIFSISHHCIQRILERKEGKDGHQTTRDYVFEELSILPLFSAILIRTQEIAANIEVGENLLTLRTAPSILEGVDLMIPTKNGALLGNAFINDKELVNVHVRTYVSDAMLNSHMLQRKKALLDTLSQFSGTYIELWPAIKDCVPKKKQILSDLLLEKLGVYVIKDIEKFLDTSKLPLNKAQTIRTLFRLIAKDSTDRSGTSGNAILPEVIRLGKEHDISKVFDVIEKQIKNDLFNLQSP